MEAEIIKISVIIPHLNQNEYLIKCLDSLCFQSQHCLDVEIIVVDNGSTKLPEEVVSRYWNVRLAQEAVPGPGPARNAGISLSRAPVLAFIDADCTADPTWLATIRKAFEAEPHLQVIGGDVRIAYDNPDRMTILEAYESVYAYRQQDYIERQGFSGTGNLAMRREAYDAVGPFAGIGVAEDRDWGRRATGKGFKIKYVAEMIVFHPARRNFKELYAKWDRHVAHDYAEIRKDILAKLRWTVKAIALALSPLWEALYIARSGRIAGPRTRLLSFIGLVRIRLYRAWRMFGVFLWSEDSTRNQAWNRR